MARHMKFEREAVAEITMMVTSPHRTKRASEILLSFSLRVGFYKFGRVAVAKIRMMLIIHKSIKCPPSGTGRSHTTGKGHKSGVLIGCGAEAATIQAASPLNVR